MAYSQILISVLLLQGFLFSDAFVMPRDDSPKLPDVIYDFCAKETSTCLGGYKKPAVECLGGKNCTTVVAFEKVDGTYVFQTLTQLTTDAVYVGIGLSVDAEMGDDGVVECIQDNKGSSPVNVYLSRTVGKSDAVRLDDQKGLNAMVTVANDGYIYCQFNLTNSLNFGDFSVSLGGDNEYYLFGVAGGAKMDGSNIVGVNGHRASRMVSDNTYFKDSGSSSIVACFSLISILLFLTKFC